MQYLNINLKNAEDNFNLIKFKTKKKIICVVKSDAYGHGAEKLSVLYQNLGTHAFMVCNLEEAIALRNFGIKKDILVAGYTPPNYAKDLANYRLTQSIIDYAYAKNLNDQCGKLGIRLNAHIKIDTGMHRFGIPYYDKEKTAQIFDMKCLSIKGAYTHYAKADEATEADDRLNSNLNKTDFTVTQYGNFLRAVKPYGGLFLHTSNSAAFVNYSHIKEDGVRLGLLLYGFIPNGKYRVKSYKDFQGLKPVMELQTRLDRIERVQKGDSIGYGGAYVCPSNGFIGIMPIGYANGFCPTGDFSVKIKNNFYKVVGRVCMNHSFIDLKNSCLKVGDTVTVARSQSDFLKLSSQNFSVYRTLTTIGGCNKKYYV